MGAETLFSALSSYINFVQRSPTSEGIMGSPVQCEKELGRQGPCDVIVSQNSGSESGWPRSRF